MCDAARFPFLSSNLALTVLHTDNTCFGRSSQGQFIRARMGSCSSVPGKPPKGAFKIQLTVKAGLKVATLWDVLGDFESAAQVMMEGLGEDDYKPTGGNEVGVAKRVIKNDGREWEEKLVEKTDTKVAYEIHNIGTPTWKSVTNGLKVSYEVSADGEGSQVAWTWEGDYMGPETPDPKKPPGHSYEEFEKWVKESVAKWMERGEGFAEMM